jgi:diacylglycerol kinase
MLARVTLPASSSGRRAGSRLASFRYAFQGLRHVLWTQPNSRIHVVATVAVVALAWWLRLERGDWAILLLTIALVWVAELGNTAVEAAVDLAAPEYHRLARVAKDSAAAAVLVGALVSVAVGFLILGPPLWNRLAGLWALSENRPGP